MSIIRGPRKTGNFYVLDKSISEDTRLTWAARGLLIFLLGKPDHWEVSIKNLRNETKQSRRPTERDGVYALLDELIQAGYVTRTQERLPSGKLGDVDYLVSENSTAPPLPAQPYPAQPYPANPTQVRTDGSEDLSRGRKEGPARKKRTAPVPGHTPSPSSFENGQPEQPEQPTAPTAPPAAPADALAPLVARINAQRANNGKGAYTQADIAQLEKQAALAGITPEMAALWVLERPGRNFFQASYYNPQQTPASAAPTPAPAPVAPTAPAPAKSPEELAELEATAKAARERARQVVEEMRKTPKRAQKK